MTEFRVRVIPAAQAELGVAYLQVNVRTSRENKLAMAGAPGVLEFKRTVKTESGEVLEEWVPVPIFIPASMMENIPTTALHVPH